MAEPVRVMTAAEKERLEDLRARHKRRHPNKPANRGTRNFPRPVPKDPEPEPEKRDHRDAVEHWSRQRTVWDGESAQSFLEWLEDRKKDLTADEWAGATMEIKLYAGKTALVGIHWTEKKR